MKFLPYKKIRFIWKKAFLNHLLKHKMITEEEHKKFTEIYKNGFYVYSQHITGNQNDALFRTAEYKSIRTGGPAYWLDGHGTFKDKNCPGHYITTYMEKERAAILRNIELLKGSK